jgi:hypothetical protein
VLRSFRRQLPEYILSEADESLTEGSPADSLPRSEAVLSADGGVEEQCGVLK